MNLTRLLSLLLPLGFLLASCATGPRPVTLCVVNDSDRDRHDEPVAVSAEALQARLQLADTARFVVLDARGRRVPYQLTYDGLLLFPATVAAGGRALYTVQAGRPLPPSTAVRGVAGGRQVAWGGPGPTYVAPAAPYGSAYGVLAGSERRAGRSLRPLVAPAIAPCGDLALVGRDSLMALPGWSEYEVLDNGPLRFTLKLLDAAVPQPCHPLRTTRLITLDAGSLLNRVVVTVEGNDASLPLAVRLPLRRPGAPALAEAGSGLVAAADTLPASPHEVMYMGCVLASAGTKAGVRRHVAGGSYAFAMPAIRPGATTFTYYFGATLNHRRFPTWQSWVDFLAGQARTLRTPLRVEVR